MKTLAAIIFLTALFPSVSYSQRKMRSTLTTAGGRLVKHYKISNKSVSCVRYFLLAKNQARTHGEYCCYRNNPNCSSFINWLDQEFTDVRRNKGGVSFFGNYDERNIFRFSFTLKWTKGMYLMDSIVTGVKEHSTRKHNCIKATILKKPYKIQTCCRKGKRNCKERIQRIYKLLQTSYYLNHEVKFFGLKHRNTFHAQFYMPNWNQVWW